MHPKQFATDGLPPRQQFEAWRSWFDPVFDTVTQAPPEAGFDASATSWQFAGCVLSRVSAPALRAVRTPPLLRRAPVDNWVITIGSDVVTTLTTARGTVLVPPGTPFVLSLGAELVSERARDSRLQLYLSRDGFPELASILDATNGAAIDGRMGALLADYMRLLERNLPQLDDAERPGLKDAVGAMVAACVAPSADRMAAAALQVAVGRKERLRKAVGRHLRSVRLTPELLCREVGMSRSQLYRLLEPEGGVARYINRRRLREAYALLSDPLNDKPIAAIAEELCFADASGFSRAFRREFGMSPTDVRDGPAAAERAQPAAGKSAPRRAADGLAGWLRTT